MTEQSKECDLSIPFSQNISNIKEELEGNDYLDNKVYICETNIYKQDTQTKNCGEDVKTEQYEMSSVNNIKTELYEMESDIITEYIKMENAPNNSNIRIINYLDNRVYVPETVIDKNNIETRNYLTEQYEIPVVGNIKTELLPEIESDIIQVDIKIEDGIGDANIKTEYNNELLFCNNCHENYRNYCTKCGMLVHILNANTLSETDNTAVKEIPTDILEIRESPKHVGIFAMKGIPVGVRFGPFTGLNASECSWRLKGGKFIVSDDKSMYLNWMQYINPARDMFQQNLFPFQFEDNLYYSSNREIQKGEELLVYFGEGYEAKLNDNVVLDFIPPIEEDFRDVFACTFCYLGFSSREYLIKHKSTCSKENNGMFSIEELTQCQFCKIYLYKKEYLEYHKTYCSQINIRFPSGKNFVATTMNAEWTRHCKRADNFKSNTSHIYCDHSKEADHEQDLQNELLGLPLRKKLKETAVLTVNLPRSKSEIGENSRNHRMAKRKRKEIVTNLLASEPQPQPSCSQTSDSQLHTLSSSEQKYQELLNKYNNLQKTFLEFKKYNRKEVKNLNALVNYYKKKKNRNS